MAAKKQRIIHRTTEAERKEYRDKVAQELADIDYLKAQGRALRKRRQEERAEIAATCAVLKTERERQGLSLSDMEARTGISRGQISRLENLLESNPTISTLIRLADALGKKLTINLEQQNP